MLLLLLLPGLLLLLRNGVGWSHSLLCRLDCVNGVASVVTAVDGVNDELDGLRMLVDSLSGASHSSASNPMPLRFGAVVGGRC
jgi:hypothetical protein